MPWENHKLLPFTLTEVIEGKFMRTAKYLLSRCGNSVLDWFLMKIWRYDRDHVWIKNIQIGWLSLDS